MNYISAKFCGETIQINLDHVRVVENIFGGTMVRFSNGDTLRLDDEPYTRFEELLMRLHNGR